MPPTIPFPPLLARVRARATGIAAIFLVVLVAGRFLLGFETELARAEPIEVGSGTPGALYDALDAYLAEVVSDGGVRYASALEHAPQLRRIVATLETVGPRRTPERFPDRDSKLAYYINAYNALALFGVIVNYPIDSVRDVSGIVTPEPGFGFFYALRFHADARHVNLYDLEHRTLRPFGDARVHTVLNCASASCPALASRALRPATLDAQLDRASRAFVTDPRNVRVDDGAAQVRLSAIFEWYAEDFEPSGGALAFIARHANEETRLAVERAEERGYEIAFAPFDWSLNDRP